MCQDIGDTKRSGLQMDAGRYLIAAHLREGRSISQLARVHGVQGSWLYKLLARYRSEGDAGLAALASAAPVPAAMVPEVDSALGS